MAVPLGPPKALLDALTAAGLVRAEDLPRVKNIRIDMPAGQVCTVTVERVGGEPLQAAMADFVDRLTNTDKE